MLGKRKERLIRDIAFMVTNVAERIAFRLARPQQETLENEAVERIAALVIEAIRADRIEWMERVTSEAVDITRKTPGVPYAHIVDPYYQYFDRTPKTGELLIVQTGPKLSDYRLVAYLSDAVPYIFKRGTIVECEAAWPNAVKWMEERFPKNKA